MEPEIFKHQSHQSCIVEDKIETGKHLKDAGGPHFDDSFTYVLCITSYIFILHNF